MLSYIEIDLENISNFYNDFEITDEDIASLQEMVIEGRGQEAIDLLLSEYIIHPGIRYQNVMVRYLGYSVQGPLKAEDKNRVIRNISILGMGLTALLVSNYKKFIKGSYAEFASGKAGLENSKIINSVIDEISTQFEQSINTSISQSQFFILNAVKSLQKEMLAENGYLRTAGLSEAELIAQIESFKNSLKTKFPEVFKAIKEGNVIVTTKFSEEGYVYRHYKAEHYLDLVARNAVLDFDRTLNIVSATVAGERVVEYYWVDRRQVQKDREICIDILANKVNGLSILALDEEAASKLGVMTVSEAESQTAMGLNCRHGVRRCSQEYLDEINKMLEV